MLEKPAIEDSAIVACLRSAFGLNVSHLEFLPLGADVNTAVYRAFNGDDWFIKLRRGSFLESTVTVPYHLHKQGNRNVIAPIPTRTGNLWVELNEYKLMVFPFIEGKDGFTVDLSPEQWSEFGRALKSLHTTALPAEVTAAIPLETFSPEWRTVVREYLAVAKQRIYSDPVAQQLAALLRQKESVINQLIEHAERLIPIVQARSLPSIVCHADIHVGNVLLTTNGTLYIVDWDTLTMAPKERDLMFIGGGLGGGGLHPEEEGAAFYLGYGQTDIDRAAVAYYRCERIVEDIAAYCAQILLTEGDSADRTEGLAQLRSQFEPHQVVDLALQSVRAFDSPDSTTGL
ncbi:MAG: aminoglycoside phosphotransferase family protein [Anaerolineae bacterium]